MMRKLWEYRLPGSVNEGPLLWQDRLAVWDTDGHISILNPQSGENLARWNPYARGFNVTLLNSQLLLTVLQEGQKVIDLATLELRDVQFYRDGCYSAVRPFWAGDALVTAEGIGSPMTRDAKPKVLFGLNERLERLHELPLDSSVCLVYPFPPLGILSINESESQLILYQYHKNWAPHEIPTLGQRFAVVREGIGRTYMLMRGGLWRVLDCESLEEINQRTIPLSGKLLAHDDRVYISCPGKMVICDRDLQNILLELDANDRRFDSGIQSRACLVGSRMVCFGSNNERLWCFDRHTGELLETIEFRDFVVCNPIIDGERLYVCCFDGTVTCYDASEYLD